MIATEWPEFKELDSAVARPVMAVPLVIDGRHLFDPAVMRDLRFHYEPVGSPATKAVPSR